MKLWTFDKWSAVAKTKTDASDDADLPFGQYVGIAIGPQSDDGRCLIDGELLLQAGRPLPLRNRVFSVESLRPISVNASLGIKTLQLCLLEHEGELRAEYARANGEYSGKTNVPEASGYVAVCTIPFVGRRQARFQLISDAATINYRVYGLRYHGSTRTVKATLLRETLAAAPDTDDTVAFYMGGTNEAECWDALRVDVDTPTNSDIHFDVETIGEIGAR